MKKGIISILFAVVVGLLVVGCADPNGAGTTGGGGTAGGTGIDLENAYIGTVQEESYTQWVIDGSSYTAQDFENNVKISESVYTFEVASDFTGDIFVEYWDEVTEDPAYTTTPLTTTGYTIYKGTDTHRSVGYFLVKKDVNAFQIVELEEIRNDMYDPTGDYYVSGKADSTLDEIMGENTYTSSNGTYSNRRTHSRGISIVGNTLTVQSSTNGIKNEEYVTHLETISPLPLMYYAGDRYNEQAGEFETIYGTTPIDVTGYTLYRATYTKFLELNEEGLWEDILLGFPSDERSGYVMVKIDGDNLYLIFVDMHNDTYYIWTDDINNPILEPNMYTKQ